MHISTYSVIIMISAGSRILCKGFLQPFRFSHRLFTSKFSILTSVEGNSLFTNSVKFEETGISKILLHALQSQNLSLATPIQQMTFPIIYSGMDTIIGAETGSGKTLAYLLPLIDAYLSLGDIDAPNYPCGVILAPTKELCWQIEEMAKATVADLNNQGIKFRIGDYYYYSP